LVEKTNIGWKLEGLTEKDHCQSRALQSAKLIGHASPDKHTKNVGGFK
jgi:hypothetical protein